MPAIYASMRSAGNAALYPSMGEAAPVVVPNAPAGVTATPTGGTAADLSLTETNGGTASYRWQISLVGSGTWADAVGGSNPGALGATTFSATGGTPATEWLVRARAENAAGDSAWVQAATSFWFDNTGTGGGVIGAADTTAPTLTGNIAITALTSTSYTATCPAASDAVGVTGYQWRLGGAGAWTDILAGGRTANFVGRTPAATDSLEMRARDASGNFSIALTTNITLLGIAPTVTTQPQGVSVIAGDIATFTAAFAGTPTPTRQWYRNGAAISGATGLSYSLTTVLGDAGALFTCTATNSAGTVTTNAAALTVTQAVVAPSIVTQPASQTVQAGADATFTVLASGTAPISYQWLRNGAAISGATSASYTFQALLADQGALFSATVTNAAGTVTSAAATLTISSSSVTLPSPLSISRQYKVNPDTHLDAYSIQQGYALTWAKDPGATLDYSIDWTDWLADVPGDSLASLAVVSSANINVPAQGIVGAVTAIMARGGVAGAKETATLRVTTALGRIDERTITLMIQDR